MRSHRIKRHTQQGGALMILVLVLVIAGATSLFSVLDGSGVKVERDKKTAAALAEAKVALIGYALKSGVSSGQARPGDLPCPDNNAPGTLEGQSTTPCAAGALGRLPWKTLGIPDLRDGEGERLWYAVSSNFKNNPRAAILNSDTQGTISLRNSAGILVNDGTAESAAIAVVIAPGFPLLRLDDVSQNHANANYNNPKHYLDIFDTSDNSDFQDSTTNGFINGVIKSNENRVFVNDHIVAINYKDLMPLIERRVANEIKRSLKNMGGLPWAAAFTDPSLSNNNFVPVDNLNGGLLSAYPHYWDILDPANPTSAYVTRSGNVTVADLVSGFVEPGYCSQNDTQIVCSGRKQILIGGNLAWRDLSIDVTGNLDSSNSFPSAPLTPMVGSLTITDTRISDGAVLGTGSVTPTSTTEISITPQRSTSFPLWLTANNWHHLVYYAVATPFVYSSSSQVCPPCLSVNHNGGLMSDIGSLVMLAGKRLDATDYQPGVAQNRSIANLRDYYDTSNNQSAGTLFDWNRAFTSTFNDQLVIVAP
jgi:type II secretory pathway pseudopilin PulG